MLNIKKRLDDIEWSNYDHPCGFDSNEIPSLIIKLFDQDDDVSLRAANRLWDVVGHQANVGSNSVPTLPFLIEALEYVNIEVITEILEIISYFSCISLAIVLKENIDQDDNVWGTKLFENLVSYKSVFEKYLNSTDEDVKVYATFIVKDITAKKYLHNKRNEIAK